MGVLLPLSVAHSVSLSLLHELIQSHFMGETSVSAQKGGGAAFQQQQQQRGAGGGLPTLSHPPHFNMKQAQWLSFPLLPLLI